MKNSILLGLGLLALAGCGEPSVSMPSPVAVAGTLKTADGKPVAGVRVLLLTVNTKAGANGITGADGAFKLTTYDNKEGAIPGKYRVQLTPIMAGNRDETLKSQAVLKALPPRYTADDSTLEIEVVSGKPLDIMIDAK